MIALTPALRAEYQALFADCQIRKERASAVAAFAARVLAGSERYRALVSRGGWVMPWWVVGLIHGLEGSFGWGVHLHNGDSLRARTVNVPAGRPVEGRPPFTWEQSAADALRYDGLTGWGDWSLSGTLYCLERFNGMGYRQFHPATKSPYLWSFSNHYTGGKYVADGIFRASVVSGQVGAAVALRHLVNQNQIRFA